MQGTALISTTIPQKSAEKHWFPNQSCLSNKSIASNIRVLPGKSWTSYKEYWYQIRVLIRKCQVYLYD